MNKKEMKEFLEDSKKYFYLYRSKGIEISKENFKLLSADILSKQKIDNDYTIYGFYRPKKALPIEVIRELTGLSERRILEIELWNAIIYKK